MKKVSGRQLANPSEGRTEMKPKKIFERSFIMAMALAVVFALAAAWPCSAAPAGPKECGLIGTWYGSVGASLKWLSVHTAGTDDKNGQMQLNWVRVEDWLVTVDPFYPTATSLTAGHGVWEQTRKGEYKYTWYAYGISTLNDVPLYSVRVSGTSKNTDCNNIEIYYTYEIFDGFVLPQGMSGLTPVGSITDVASGTRVPLTVVTP